MRAPKKGVEVSTTEVGTPELLAQAEEWAHFRMGEALFVAEAELAQLLGNGGQVAAAGALGQARIQLRQQRLRLRGDEVLEEVQVQIGGEAIRVIETRIER